MPCRRAAQTRSVGAHERTRSLSTPALLQQARARNRAGVVRTLINQKTDEQNPVAHCSLPDSVGF
jgi:hypothetical protein